MSHAIRRNSREHLGFVLTSDESNECSCVIRSLPAQAADFDAADSLHLYELQLRGEFHWSQTDDVATIKDGQGNLVAKIVDGKLFTGGFTLEVVPLK